MTLAAGPINRGKPSFAPGAPSSAATVLPPPGLFSITNCWPIVLVSRCPMTRAVRSAAEPGPKPTTIRTGLVGYVPCAKPGAGAARSSNTPAHAFRPQIFEADIAPYPCKFLRLVGPDAHQ